MRTEDYPPQEPFSEAAQGYHDEVTGRPAPEPDAEVLYGDDPYQGISVFHAAEPDGRLLAFMHGGGWTNGYKEWMAFMAPALTAAGVTFASVGYRLAPRHVFPVGFEDSCRGLAWLYRHARDHGADPGRIFVGGHSAGGHYAALMAVRRDWQEALELPRDAIRGCLPISGVYILTEGSGLPMRPRFLGPDGNEEQASPIHNIQGPPPPFLIAHGDQDFPHLRTQAEAMEDALGQAGGDVERLVLGDCNHFSASYVAGDAEGPWLGRADVWMAAR
ncbi:MAG: alpha/beta hydrolase [Alphaproteobacteria bacterium]